MSNAMTKIVFVDGVFQESLSSIEVVAEQLRFESEIFYLHFPKNFSTEQPIHLHYINKTPGVRQLKRNIVIEENAELVLIESFEGSDDLDYENQLETQVTLKKNARARYYKSQKEGEKAIHKAVMKAEQASQSYFGTYHVLLSGQQLEDEFTYCLQGLGATCESIGFYQAADQQKFRVNSRIHHQSSSTNSRQLYKGIADDQSHAIFNGMVMVDPNIHEICAHQKNDNLLLSKQARVDTKPELEIYSEDVRCSHGATIGQLDEEALFYLRSRGVEEKEARNMLTDGFANEIFNAFPDQEMLSVMRFES